MKKLLATTALCLVFSTGLTGTAKAAPLDVTPSYTIESTLVQVLKTEAHMPAITLYQGDFQQITRAVTPQSLYTGTGSALMSSLRNVTD